MMADELTTANDLAEGQIVVDTQDGLEIQVAETGDVFVLENEHGRTEATSEQVEAMIEQGMIRARTEDEIVDSILDNFETVDEETAWERARGPAGKEDEIRNYPMVAAKR